MSGKLEEFDTDTRYAMPPALFPDAFAAAGCGRSGGREGRERYVRRGNAAGAEGRVLRPALGGQPRPGPVLVGRRAALPCEGPEDLRLLPVRAQRARSRLRVTGLHTSEDLRLAALAREQRRVGHEGHGEQEKRHRYIGLWRARLPQPALP